MLRFPSLMVGIVKHILLIGLQIVWMMVRVVSWDRVVVFVCVCACVCNNNGVGISTSSWDTHLRALTCPILNYLLTYLLTRTYLLTYLLTRTYLLTYLPVLTYLLTRTYLLTYLLPILISTILHTPINPQVSPSRQKRTVWVWYSCQVQLPQHQIDHVCILPQVHLQ